MKSTLEKSQKVKNDDHGFHHILENVSAYSGYDLSDVGIHTNSSQPDRMGAYAFTQGNQIYLGPGQESYFPHEAWHVVQNKQGRATGTMYKGRIYENSVLEKEADHFGSIAAMKGGDLSRPLTRGITYFGTDIPILRAAKKNEAKKTPDVAAISGIVGTSKGAGPVPSENAAEYIVKCQQRYREEAHRFEPELGRKFLLNSEVNLQADALIGRLNLMLQALVSSVAVGSDTLYQELIDSMNIGSDYFGAVKDAEEVKKVLSDAKSASAEKKYKVLHDSVRSGTLPGLLKILADLHDKMTAAAKEPTPPKAETIHSSVSRIDLRSSMTRNYDVDGRFYETVGQQDPDMIASMASGNIFDTVKAGKETVDFGRSNLFTMSSLLFDREKADRTSIKDMAVSEADRGGYQVYKTGSAAGIKRGQDIYDVLEGSQSAKTAARSMARMLSGISGTTGMMFPILNLLGMGSGKNPQCYRLGLAGWMMAGGDHSFYEVYRAAEDITGIKFIRGEEIGYIGGEYEDDNNLYPMKLSDLDSSFAYLPSYFMSDAYILELINKNEPIGLGATDKYTKYFKDSGITELDTMTPKLDDIQSVHMYNLIESIKTLGTGLASGKYTTKFSYHSFRQLKRSPAFIYLANTMEFSLFNPVLRQICNINHIPAEFILFLWSDENKNELNESAPGVHADIQKKNARTLFLNLGFTEKELTWESEDALQKLAGQVKEWMLSYDKEAPKTMENLAAEGLSVGFLSKLEDLLQTKQMTILEGIKTDSELEAMPTIHEEVDLTYDSSNLTKRRVLSTEDGYWRNATASETLIKNSWDDFLIYASKGILDKIDGTLLKGTESGNLTAAKAATPDPVLVKACLDKIDKAKEDIQAAQMDTALDETALKTEITRLNGVINTELASLKGVKKALTDFFEDFKGNLDFNSSAPNEKLRVIMLRNCIKVTLEKKDPAMAALSMLHERELGAIFNYTSDRYKSFTANAAETAAADLATPLSSKATRFAGPIKATGISGLRKLPVYHKPLYRIGGKKPEAETAMRALALGKIGIVVNCGSFHSAAKSTGSDFIRSNFIDKNTLELITKVKTGHDIEHVSYFKGEQEVCFEPGAKFLIKSAQLLKDYTGTDANIIRMKQRDTIPNKYHILVEEEEQ